MLTRMTFASIVALIAFGAVAFVAVPGVEATTTSWWERITQTRWDPCNGESIRIAGRIHHSESVNFDGNGGFHVSLNSNSSQMTAVGVDSGNTYQANVNQHMTYNARPPFPVVSRIGESARFVPTGGGNPIMCSRFHTLHVNGNGTLVRTYTTLYTCRCP